MDITIIGQRIASLRKEKGVKQEELANYVGVTAQAVSKWENGGVPDTELLPKIADFFGVSIDTLFDRTATDYKDFHLALMEKIANADPKERFKLAFDYCWDMARALYGQVANDGDIAEYEKAIGKNSQRYSSMMYDEGFTRMGIANCSQYFLLVPEQENKDLAYFEDIDYVKFFKDFSDKDVFDACVMLYKRDCKKAFTPNLLIKNMGVEFDRAMEIIRILYEYNLIRTTYIEMDDVTQEVYTFNPTPSFVALLIFAHEMIAPPNTFVYFMSNRSKPYLA